MNPFDRIPNLGDPARDLAPVTPSDTGALPQVATALFVETGGTVRIVTALGAERDVTLPDFTLLPVGVRAVRATGTTASGIHALTHAL